MEEMKNLRISDDTHKWLMMQRALTNIPANRQVDELVREKRIATEQATDAGKLDNTTPQN
jgi:hypothetical protein